MLGHVFGVMVNPVLEWQKIAALPDKEIKKLLLYPIFMALLPAVAFYVGTTSFGWKILGGEVTKLTPESGIPLAILFYIALISSVVFIGWMMDWMSKTYSATSFPIKGVVFIGYACTPIFLAGLFGFYPVWWFDLILATAACGYAIRLIYLGVPAMMKVSEDRGFLYASAVFMIALVYVVCVLVATALLWEYVATPVFTD
jgi:Yip1 domain